MPVYVLTPEAGADLVGVRSYLRRENRQAWGIVRRDLERAFRMLAASPGIGHARTDLTGKPVLFWPVYSYLVVYDPESVPVHILGVIHGARDVRWLLGD